MQQHKTLPLTFDGWDTAGDYGDIQFYDVVFTDDFGPIKKGQKFRCLARVDSEGVLIAYDDNGQETLRIPIKYIPS